MIRSLIRQCHIKTVISSVLRFSDFNFAALHTIKLYVQRYYKIYQVI